MPWISNKFLLSLCYVNMILGHTRVINKYVNIKCSLFLEIRDLTAFCFYSKNFKCVYKINITIQSNFGAQYADYIKPALCTNFPRVLFQSFDLQKREGI